MQWSTNYPVITDHIQLSYNTGSNVDSKVSNNWFLITGTLVRSFAGYFRSQKITISLSFYIQLIVTLKYKKIMLLPARFQHSKL